MLRAAHLPRSQSAAYNFSLVTKRWQQTPASPGTGITASTKSTPGSHTTQYATNNSSSTLKTQTATARPSFNAPIDRTNNPNKTTNTPPSYIPPPSARSSPPTGSGSSGSGGGRMIKSIIYGVTLGLTATLVYAEYENGPFRRQLESTIPYSSTVLGGLDQVIDPVFGRQKPFTKEITDKIPDLAYVKDKIPGKEQIKKIGEQVKDTTNNVLEKLPDKTTIKKAGESAKDAVSNTYHKLTDQNKAKGVVDQATNQVKDAVNTVREALPDTAGLKKGLTHAKEQVQDAAHTVKETVKDALPLAKGKSGEPTKKIGDPMFLEEAGDMAVPPPIPEDKYKKLEEEINHLFAPLSKQLDDALTAAREHVSHMKTLIENPNISTSDHETWKKAEHLQEQARTSYDKVTDTLREWKNKLIEYTTTTSGQIHPEEKKVDEKYQELHKQYTTSTFVKNFRTYIDDATKSFQKEIETMFPSLAGKNPTQLTHEDLQALLVHAHRRIVKLQNDIARMRVNESDSVKAAIDVQRADIDRLVEQRVQERVAKTAEQLTDELKSYEKNLRQQFDEQLKHEIVLQHQALTQYLADVLSRQYQEWAREYEKQLDNESTKINLNLQNQLRTTLDRLHAIEQAIEANYDSQERGRKAQHLWIQAQNILNKVVHGTTTENDLDVISKIVPNEKFVQVLFNQLKTDESPITNEEMLRERFSHVKKLCRRVALIDDGHNSLWNYFLSYFQSLLIVRQRDDSILVDDAIDLNQLDTFTILNYVQSYLEHNQWYNALRLMQLLTGEPKNVAQSWINDTRNYLAKKQTSELLEAYSNSIGLGTLPRTA
ncbi:unnamed protein product [Adineta steineri]|uniref:MICOS complex subunit MIC60 n=1 Tax=Adineta steineri TaxID=433720 RepID=A0A819KXQ6_9BILA|nr:unnamed protein product [Adineta steineri]CAF3953680.1 unnamed protein product [Adineta steineri]